MKYDESNKMITTERLVIRLFHESDVVNVANLCNNYNIYKNTLYLPYPYSVDDAKSWIQNHLENYNNEMSYEFAITDKENGELYGAIALLSNQKFNNGEIAYWIGEEFWGNGYATEAAQAILWFAFNEKHLHKVFARYFKTNPASGRVMQKLGMREEGVLIDQVKKDNHYLDLVYYGIINSYK
ncbi:GNAT family N-acetyltransferase [Cytobacillus oceanisediminis]|nr:GNAT family N-acetyltransferase [Cytobacillus oceanisediminis]MBZ9535551.1 GNAT family N-acetyltransferase [Cytobacillus oceanisediminis]